jgi:peptidoglycan/LPS O-acetylase OafA/YrhL
MPRIREPLWNGLYESAVILFGFPLVVLLGAGGEIRSQVLKKVCTVLGDFSYPIYLFNGPLLYLLWGWIKDTHYVYSTGENLPPRADAWGHFLESMPQACCMFFGTLAISWVVLRFYDEPVRNWLGRVLGA